MSRAALPIGTWGRIHARVEKRDDKGEPVSYRAQAKFRDHDGVTRPVSAFGRTKTAAERAVLKKLQDRAKTGHGGELTAMHKINHLLDLWITKFKDQIADGTRSPTSLDTYQRAIKNHVRPALGELRIGEANTPRVDTVISNIKKNAGPPTAKTCRAIISGMMQLAVRIGESLAVLWSQVDLDAGTVDITHTIVRIKGESLIRKPGKSRTSNRQVGLPNWLIATLRTRAATGIRLDDPIFTDTAGGYRDPNNVRRSLRNALAPVGGTARRNLGQALRATRRQAGLSREEVATTLNWPKNRIELIETGRIKVDRTMATALLWTYNPTPETTEALLAQVDEAAAPVPTDTLTWITSHAFRKAVATALDKAGQSARGAANQLGHSRVSMTQDHYFDRKAPNPAATQAIQQAFEDPDVG